MFQLGKMTTGEITHMHDIMNTVRMLPNKKCQSTTSDVFRH